MSTFALILAGGVGTRMGQSIPKQYIEIEGKPVLIHTLEKFQACEKVDHIVIVADEEWRDQIRQWLDRYGITKFLDFAAPGVNRQESIFSGLTTSKTYAKDEQDVVVVHDAARALITTKLLGELIDALEGYDGCMAYLPLKDAIFFSEDGKTVSDLVDRNKLFSAQTPECFYLLPYWDINNRTSPDERARIMGNYELAYKYGWRIHPYPGDENNFKLTTPADLERMTRLLQTSKG